MSENGGSLWGGGSPWNYQSLDNKIVRVEEDLRGQINEVRREIREGITALGEKLDRRDAHQKVEKPANGSNQIYGFIGTAVGIISLLGTWFSYVSSNLESKIQVNRETIESVDKARVEGQKLTFEKLVSKDAFAEHTRRIDERNELEQKYTDRMLAKFDSELVPRTENDQRWKDQTEDIGRLERQLSNSIDRVVEHLNKSDETSSNKFTELEKVVHGYGLGDEVKDLQTQVRNATDKLFDLISRMGSKVDQPKP